MKPQITLQDSFRAQKRIAKHIYRTPLIPSPTLSSTINGQVYLKLENLQITGSFKLRGATNAVKLLPPKGREIGVVSVSTGNHGRGLAYITSQEQIKCIICLSKLVPPYKVEAIKSLGAEVRIIGNSQDDAQQEEEKLKAQGLTTIPPFDHHDIIAGQSTLGLEILEQCPDLDTIIVPLSGGGLISGIAMVMKSAYAHIRVIGVSMERGAAMYLSQQAGAPIWVKEEPTLADALGGGIGLDNQYTFEMTRDLVDEIILVSETEIATAIFHAYEEERQIIEGSGSVGIAALLAGKIKNIGQCVCLLSGQNIDTALHRRIINHEFRDVF